MCRHEFYISRACKHYFPKVDRSPSADFFPTDKEDNHPIPVPRNLACTPVKLALKFYHDQVVYQPVEKDYSAKVEMPRSCPIVHTPPNGVTPPLAKLEQLKADNQLRSNMFQDFLRPPQMQQVEKDSRVPGRCSNRMKPGEHNPKHLERLRRWQYPGHMYEHVQRVKAYQARDPRHMEPNVDYYSVDFGCGGPFSAACLTGWEGSTLVTHRLHLWSDATTHLKPCNDQCLAGWSGTDLDTYRQQTWANVDPTAFETHDYPKRARKHLSEPPKECAILDWSNISDMHSDQWHWSAANGRQRRGQLPSGHDPNVPDHVWAPLPTRLYNVYVSGHRVLAEQKLTEMDKRKIADEKIKQEVRERIAKDFPNENEKGGDVVVEEG